MHKLKMIWTKRGRPKLLKAMRANPLHSVIGQTRCTSDKKSELDRCPYKINSGLFMSITQKSELDRCPYRINFLLFISITQIHLSMLCIARMTLVAPHTNGTFHFVTFGKISWLHVVWTIFFSSLINVKKKKSPLLFPVFGACKQGPKNLLHDYIPFTFRSDRRVFKSNTCEFITFVNKYVYNPCKVKMGIYVISKWKQMSFFFSLPFPSFISL